VDDVRRVEDDVLPLGDAPEDLAGDLVALPELDFSQTGSACFDAEDGPAAFVSE
jgi:hypothetical protein